MATYACCGPDGTIHCVGRREELPDEINVQMNIPEGGFFLDITGQGDFDAMDILDIHNNYKADVKKKKLVKIK